MRAAVRQPSVAFTVQCDRDEALGAAAVTQAIPVPALGTLGLRLGQVGH
jgi:hypothetical protein